MNIRNPLALASTALVSLTLAACAHTGAGGTQGASAAQSESSTDIGAGSTAGAGASMGSPTHGTGAAHGTAGGSVAGQTAGSSAATGQAGGSATAASPTGASASAAAGSPNMPVPIATRRDELLALVAMVDQHEVKLAQQAQSKGVTGPVLEYARMMEAHHTKHLAQTRALAAAKDNMASNSSDVQNMMEMDRRAQARLGGLEGEAYARAYIAHMVASHEHGIAMIDSSKALAEKDAALRGFLATARQAMQMHLDRARALHAQLGG